MNKNYEEATEAVKVEMIQVAAGLVNTAIHNVVDEKQFKVLTAANDFLLKLLTE